MRSRNYSGFTLIELLVVIAIIAVLLAILTPTLINAKELTKRTICAAQMRDLGMGAMHFGQDHCNSLPKAQVQTDGPSAGIYTIWVNTWKKLSNQDRYRGHGVLAWQNYIDPKQMYCPCWTFENCQYGKVNDRKPSQNGGPYWTLEDKPSYQQYMQTSYHYRGSFDGPKWRAGNLCLDAPCQPIMADAFTSPYRGVDQCHQAGYNVTYLDGHASFVLDPDHIVRDYNGGAGYHCTRNGYLKQEEVWKNFFANH